MKKVGVPDKYRRDNQNEHFLVIVDNLMNLDFLFDVSEWTGDNKYRDMAISQADKMQTAHVRDDGTTWHVVNFGHDGQVLERMTHQGECKEQGRQALRRSLSSEQHRGSPNCLAMEHLR